MKSATLNESLELKLFLLLPSNNSKTTNMTIPSMYEATTVDNVIARLEKLSAESAPKWGKMNSAQMLAHLNVGYDMAFGKKEVKMNGFMKLMMKMFVKKTVVTDKPYKKNSRTADFFLIVNEREFAKEKEAFLTNIKETQSKGKSFFEGLDSPSFGPLTATEWNFTLQKHIEHHFEQFGL
ncbi:MAG: hypothetical protein ACI89M_002048 [Chitinophagales bacterium]|jgi:hypothetical protein